MTSFSPQSRRGRRVKLIIFVFLRDLCVSAVDGFCSLLRKKGFVNLSTPDWLEVDPERCYFPALKGGIWTPSRGQKNYWMPGVGTSRIVKSEALLFVSAAPVLDMLFPAGASGPAVPSKHARPFCAFCGSGVP